MALSHDKLAVCVGGVPGVGKTTLLRAYVERPGCRDRHIPGSSVIKQLIAPATVLDMDRWPEERRTEVREAAIRHLRSELAEGPGHLLVDGHFTLRNRDSGVVERVFTDGDRALYGALIVLDADPEQVFRLRRDDVTRQRRMEVLDELAAHLEAERREALRSARRMGAPVLIIKDDDLGRRLRLLTDFLAESAAPVPA